MRIKTENYVLNVLATVTLIVSFLLLASAALAQEGSMSKTGLMANDQKFVSEAAQAGMAEVELGKVAVQNASSSEVKAFGQRMIDDHSKANEKLKDIAASKSFSLPADVNAEQKMMRSQLAGHSGAEFDRRYVKHMVEDHKKVVAKFEAASRDAKDADVKNFATTTLPTLKEHLKMVQDMAAKMGSK